MNIINNLFLDLFIIDLDKIKSYIQFNLKKNYNYHKKRNPIIICIIKFIANFSE